MLDYQNELINTVNACDFKFNYIVDMAECTTKSNDLADIPKCTSCRKTLQQPIRLQCFHSYCEQCLGNNKKDEKDSKSGWKCLKCGTFTEINVAKEDLLLKKLILLEENKEKVKKQDPICEFCEGEKNGLLFCTECRMSICSKCKCYHEKAPALKQHSIVKIYNINETNETMINELHYCSKHDQQILETFCKTCDEVICKSCLKYHNEHSMQTCEASLSEKVIVMDDCSKNINAKLDAADMEIDGINKEIEKIRETYTKWRIESDSKFEMLINRLKATKAILEEHVNEEESRNIKRLMEMRSKIQNQAERFRAVSMRAVLVKTKTKQQSQLMELQSGLLELAKRLSMEEIQTENFQVTSPYIENNVYEYSDEEIFKILRPVQFKNVKKYMDHSGIQIRKHGNVHMCDDLNQYFIHHLEKGTAIKLPTYTCRVNMIDELLSMGLPSSNIIQQYNTAGVCVHQYNNAHNTGVIKQAHNGYIIAGGDEGLYTTNFTDWSLLQQGKFSDIAIHGNRFTALEYAQGQIVSFQLCYNNNKCIYEWQLKSSFNIAKDHKGNIDSISTLAVTNGENSVIVCDRNTLLVYSNTGQYVKSISLLLGSYRLTGIDSKDNVLLGDWSTGNIYCINNIQEFNPTTMQQYLVFENIQYIRYTVIDCDSNLWVLKGYLNCVLTKYVPLK
jgi:hypothetical protein